MDYPLIGLLFTVGLMGSGHCLVMCGGLAAALGLNTGGDPSQKIWLMFLVQLARLFSYGVIGLLFGSSFALLQVFFDMKSTLLVLRLVSYLMLMAMGLYIGGWWFGLKRLEKLSLPIWRKIQPIQQKFVPIRRYRDALVVGLCWGWLPCGLVYSALVTAVSAGQPIAASLAMMAFGLGTLPSVFLIGSASSRLGIWLKFTVVKTTAALALLSYGGYQFVLTADIIF